MNSPGKLDLDGNVFTVGSLNGAGSASYSAADDVVITNSSSANVGTLIVSALSTSNTSSFGGRIVDARERSPCRS